MKNEKLGPSFGVKHMEKLTNYAGYNLYFSNVDNQVR